MLPEPLYDPQNHRLDQPCPEYQVRVKGHLSPELQADWFGDLRVENLDSGEALISFCAADQAYLFGVLLRLRDLGIAVLSMGPSGAERESSP